MGLDSAVVTRRPTRYVRAPLVLALLGPLGGLACTSKDAEPGVGGSSGSAQGASGGTPMSMGGAMSGGRAQGGSSGSSGASAGSAASNGGSGAAAGTSGSAGSKASGGATANGGAPSAGGTTSAGGAGASSGGTGALSGSGGSLSAGGAVGACPGSCTSEPTGSCATPQVRITSVELGAPLSYSTDETAGIPLAIAAKPGGGSRLAWVTGYSRYGSSSSSQVHVGELDCDDALTGMPFALEGHDFQDLAADADGGVVVLTRDAEGGPDEQHCGDVNNLCVLPNDRPGCYDTYMLRYDCAGQTQWMTKLTSSSESTPPYASGGGQNMFVWWYQHHGRLAYDGTNYAAYFCDAITVTNDQCSNGAGKVDIHEGDRMQVVGPDGALVKGHDSFGLGCSHSWTTRLVWDPRTSHFVMVCATDNDCRIAQPNPYRTIVAGDCDGTLFGGDVVNAGDTGYWTAWSQGGTIRLEHFTTGASDKTVTTAGDTKYPHLVAYGEGHMLLAWGAGSGLAAQVYDTTSGEPVGAEFTIAVPDAPWQSFKAFPDGSVAWASVGSASSTVQVARVLPCAD